MGWIENRYHMKKKTLQEKKKLLVTNCWLPAFSPFSPQCFQKALYSGSLKVEIVWYRVKNTVLYQTYVAQLEAYRT